MDSPQLKVSIKKAKHSAIWLKLRPYIISVSMLIFFILSLMLNGDIKPFTRRGFYCDDASINYPFRHETISLKVLMVMALIAPGLVIKLSEILLNRLLSNSNKQIGLKSRIFTKKRRKVSDALEDEVKDSNDDDKDIEEEELMIPNSHDIKRRQLIVNEENSDYEAVCSSESSLDLSRQNENSPGESGDENSSKTNGKFTRIPLESGDENELSGSISSNPSSMVLQKRVGEFQLFMFGFCTTMLLTGIGKVTLGRLRPHFLQRCKPDVDCSIPSNINKYIQDFTCTNNQLRSRDLSYIATSWPSGHASIIFYSMVYLIIYLNSVIPKIVRASSRTMTRRSDPLVLYAIYMLMTCLAFYTAMTRVSDYHHHPLDVASGAILGTIVAIVWSRTLSR